MFLCTLVHAAQVLLLLLLLPLLLLFCSTSACSAEPQLQAALSGVVMVNQGAQGFDRISSSKSGFLCAALSSQNAFHRLPLKSAAAPWCSRCRHAAVFAANGAWLLTGVAWHRWSCRQSESTDDLLALLGGRLVPVFGT
jgi:hypothetical protein